MSIEIGNLGRLKMSENQRTNLYTHAGLYINLHSKALKLVLSKRPEWRNHIILTHQLFQSPLKKQLVPCRQILALFKEFFVSIILFPAAYSSTSCAFSIMIRCVQAEPEETVVLSRPRQCELKVI